MKNLNEYWKSLSNFRRSFLVVGMIVTSPILVVLVIIIGIAEVWKLIQNMEV